MLMSIYAESFSFWITSLASIGLLLGICSAIKWAIAFLRLYDMKSILWKFFGTASAGFFAAMLSPIEGRFQNETTISMFLVFSVIVSVIPAAGIMSGDIETARKIKASQRL